MKLIRIGIYPVILVLVGLLVLHFSILNETHAIGEWTYQLFAAGTALYIFFQIKVLVHARSFTTQHSDLVHRETTSHSDTLDRIETEIIRLTPFCRILCIVCALCCLSLVLMAGTMLIAFTRMIMDEESHPSETALILFLGFLTIALALPALVFNLIAFNLKVYKQPLNPDHIHD